MENIKNKNLRTEILKTITWFDLFSHPLTIFEIFKYINYSCKLNDVIVELENFSDKIKNKNGLYYLSGREDIIEERFKRFNYFKKKIKRAKKFSKLISKIPSVSGVAISNIIGDHNLRESSDIDFFIITKSGKIWLTRFFCTFLAKILHLRPNHKTKKDKICLSFYISSDNLNLEKYLLNDKDLYFIYWLVGLEPIYDKKNIFSKFYQENSWLKKYLPNFSQSFQLSITPFEFKTISPGFIEKILKKIQLNIMPRELKNQAGKSSGVVLEDNIIKLFLEDKRLFFIDKYEENFRKNN
ncbi:MAG: hypothetical protein PHP37_00655 [Patescibacteria group bacterium]|nr:hypothetical protein [Patescibacteria group bacterium]